MPVPSLGQLVRQYLKDVEVGFAGGPGHTDFAGTVAGGMDVGVESVDLGGLRAGGSVGEFGVEHATIAGESATTGV